MCVEVLTNTIESSQLPKLRTKVVCIFSNQCIKKQQCSEISPMFLIRECGSTPYVGLAHAVPPTNTKFKPLLLPTQAGVPYTSTEHHISSLSHLWVQLSTGSQFLAGANNRHFLRFIHNNNQLLQTGFLRVY